MYKIMVYFVRSLSRVSRHMVLIMCNNLEGFVYVSIGVNNFNCFFFCCCCFLWGRGEGCASGALLVYRAQVMT